MKFEQYYRNAIDKINKKLYEVIEEEDDTNVRNLLTYSIGGKHFRGTLTLLISDVINGDKDKALKYSLISELVHDASLVQDDVIDLDLLRRGKPALWVTSKELVKKKNIKDVISEFLEMIEEKIISTAELLLKKRNIPLAILTGDVLMMKALELCENMEMIKEVIYTVKCMLRGVCREVEGAATRDDYYRIIELKTASLFRLATVLGSYTANKNYYFDAADFGIKLGILYQLTDDLCDSELPDFIDPKVEIKEAYENVISVINRFPDNEYKGVLKEVPEYMVRKLAAEKDMEDEIIKIIKGE